MGSKNIRIVVDEDTYNKLQEEQENYYEVNQRKISLADIIMHYFKEGCNNADEESENGLRIIKEASNDVEPDSNTQVSDDGEYTSFELLESTLGKVNNKLDTLDIREKQIESLERNLLNKIQNNSIQHNSQNADNSQFIAAQTEIVKLTIENSNLKSKLEFNKKHGGNTNLDDKFREMQKSLDLIEKQTKKSIIEKIIPYANPILLALHHFLTDSKLNSKLTFDDLLKTVKPIISKLGEAEQEIINAFIQKAMKDLL